MKGGNTNKTIHVIKSEKALIKLIKEEILPAYKKVHEEKKNPRMHKMERGICYYAWQVLNKSIYDIVRVYLDQTYIAPLYITKPNTEKTILPRIEWMENFIKNKSVKG